MGVVWTFLLSSILSLLSPSLWETARYRLKYCLKGPLNPKQPTNQPRQIFTPYDCLLISVSFTVLCCVSCHWIIGVIDVLQGWGWGGGQFFRFLFTSLDLWNFLFTSLISFIVGFVMGGLALLQGRKILSFRS